uniref:Uncharacterized protein n=1 Tax=Heterorhabditis bacteriophora TaxID=37862 RepID=A0A1I7WHY4_HETBA
MNIIDINTAIYLSKVIEVISIKIMVVCIALKCLKFYKIFILTPCHIVKIIYISFLNVNTIFSQKHKKSIFSLFHNFHHLN